MLTRKLGLSQKLASLLPFFVPLILVTTYFQGPLKQASIMAWMVGLPFFVLLNSRLDKNLLFLFIFQYKMVQRPLESIDLANAVILVFVLF